MKTAMSETLEGLMLQSSAYGAIKYDPALQAVAEAVKDSLQVSKNNILAEFSDMNAELIRYKALLAEIRGLYGDDFIEEGVLTDTAKHTWDELVYENKMSKALWK